MLNELAARASHVAIVLVGCCLIALLLVAVVVVETVGACLPGWGE